MCRRAQIVRRRMRQPALASVGTDLLTLKQPNLLPVESRKMDGGWNIGRAASDFFNRCHGACWCPVSRLYNASHCSARIIRLPPHPPPQPRSPQGVKFITLGWQDCTFSGRPSWGFNNNLIIKWTAGFGSVWKQIRKAKRKAKLKAKWGTGWLCVNTSGYQTKLVTKINISFVAAVKSRHILTWWS